MHIFPTSLCVPYDQPRKVAVEVFLELEPLESLGIGSVAVMASWPSDSARRLTGASGHAPAGVGGCLVGRGFGPGSSKFRRQSLDFSSGLGELFLGLAKPRLGGLQLGRSSLAFLCRRGLGRELGFEGGDDFCLSFGQRVDQHRYGGDEKEDLLSGGVHSPLALSWLSLLSLS